MGAYVTLAAGQFMNWPDMFAYGKSIFHKFYDTTRANSNTFAEYNSSTYTVVAIEDLTRIFNEISDPEVHVWAEAMLDVGWGTAAQYFHAPTRQWCGLEQPLISVAGHPAHAVVFAAGTGGHRKACRRGRLRL